MKPGGRALLWLLMMTGHSMSCFLMRQQEYDADRYEAFLVDTKALIDRLQQWQETTDPSATV